MSNEEVYIAYILEKTQFGEQLIKVAFSHPIVEYWAEPKEQKALRDYFESHHFTKERPIMVEKSELFDIMEYKIKD